MEKYFYKDGKFTSSDRVPSEFQQFKSSFQIIKILRQQRNFIPNCILKTSELDFQIFHFLNGLFDSFKFCANSGDLVFLFAHFDFVSVQFDVDSLF